MSIAEYVLLDCDVIRHFHRGNKLEILSTVYPDHLKILDIVKNELFQTFALKYPLSNFFFDNKIEEVLFPADLRYVKEYAELTSRLRGSGESACMAFAKLNPGVGIASSNIKDIDAYCNANKIPFVTTMDILVVANKRKLLNTEECNTFIQTVKAAGSRLPVNTLQEYVKDFKLREIKFQ